MDEPIWRENLDRIIYDSIMMLNLIIGIVGAYLSRRNLKCLWVAVIGFAILLIKCPMDIWGWATDSWPEGLTSYMLTGLTVLAELLIVLSLLLLQWHKCETRHADGR